MNARRRISTPSPQVTGTGLPPALGHEALQDPLMREMLRPGESLSLIERLYDQSKQVAVRIHEGLMAVELSSRLDDILEAVEMGPGVDFAKRVKDGFQLQRWSAPGLETEFKPDNEVKIKKKGVRVDHITFCAIGWLIEEGYLGKNIMGLAALENTSHPDSIMYDNMNAVELLQWRVDPNAFVPREGREDISKLYEARIAAVGYGIHRRKKTAEERGRGIEIQKSSEDDAIGNRAKEILVHLLGTLPQLPLESVIRETRIAEQTRDSSLSEADARLLATMGLGRLLGVSKAIIHGKGEDERVELQLGAPAKENDRRGEIEKKVKELLTGLTDGVELNELLSSEGNNNRVTALALGFMAKRFLVEFREAGGKNFVKPRPMEEIDANRLQLKSGLPQDWDEL